VGWLVGGRGWLAVGRWWRLVGWDKRQLPGDCLGDDQRAAHLNACCTSSLNRPCCCRAAAVLPPAPLCWLLVLLSGGGVSMLLLLLPLLPAPVAPALKITPRSTSSWVKSYLEEQRRVEQGEVSQTESIWRAVWRKQTSRLLQRSCCCCAPPTFNGPDLLPTCQSARSSGGPAA
jgi:hypothetical protein